MESRKPGVNHKQAGSIPRLRFSIRALLLLTSIAAVPLYFLILPDQVARRFTNHVNNQDLKAARSLGDEYSQLIPEFTPEPTDTEKLEISATWKRANWSDLFRFRREITVTYSAKEYALADYYYATPTSVIPRSGWGWRFLLDQ